ncbi:cell division protein FtsZ [Lichenihabitans psoromatis]|uniref:cell division protein FtsZ n=1 Tax=Lichenihabitans psoromatis TaxID=2528642 RepID=UPI0010362446|nr:cell division protein FtsZ [Lichenihabitans psoromatis]
MTINLKGPELRELKPRIMVCGIGGAGGNAVNNMIVSGLIGVDFIVANTDAQALTSSKAERIIQMGLQVTEGLGAGSQPEVGRAAAEEAIEEIRDHLAGAHMVFVTAGMGGGTGTGAAPVIARTARDMGILTVGVVTKPFQFEGQRRMRVADAGITELQKAVDTLICIPNQNLFRVANEKTTFADAFSMADQVLYSGVACITDLMVKEGLINLDFADVRAIMREMGKAMMGTGEASGDKRAIMAAEAAIANPLLDEVSMKGARGLLISITGGNDLTLYEVDEAASRIRQEVDDDANIILGATFDSNLDGIVRVSVVATGIDQPVGSKELIASETRIAEATQRLRQQTIARPVETSAVRSLAAPEHAQAYDQAPQQAQLAQPAPAPIHYAQPAPAAMSNDVELMPIQSKASVFQPQVPMHQEQPRAEHVDNGPYIPPAPQQVQRAQRMPQVEDLPMPVQNQIRAQRNDPQAEAVQADTKRRSLLERLASFGMSRGEEAAPPARPTAPAPRAQANMPAPHYGQPAPQQQAYAQPRAQQPGSVHAEYGKRPVPAAPARNAHVPADQHGRPLPHARPNEDDQLEIPAFLRRQSN